jgi:serine O-acetyltransferase
MIQRDYSTHTTNVLSIGLTEDQGPMSGYRRMIQPDWSREDPIRHWDPSRRLMQSLRDYTKARKKGGIPGLVCSKIAVVRHRFWSVVTGAEIPLNTRAIEGGLEIPHPNGIVIHPDAQIGPNCLLFQQVTLGTGPRPGLPVLGAGVEIGAGAKILGGVHIGDFAIIGANAVVITDIPAGAIAVGVPAVIKQNAHGQRERDARRVRGNQSGLYPRAKPLIQDTDPTLKA